MTIRYTLNSSGKRIAEWFDEDRELPPPKKFVMIPTEILQRQKLTGYYRRAVVVSQTKTRKGFVVQLEAVRMPSP